MKTFLKYLAAGSVALQLAAPAFAADMRLKFAGVFPVDHQGSKMMEQVKADIEAADVGLKVSVFPANQLGSGEALLEDVARGNIDFAAAFLYADTDPRLEILSMPFLVSDWDEMNSVMRDLDSEFNTIIQETLSDHGIRLLGQNPEGFVGIVATEEPANWNNFDAKNMNIRVWSSNVVKSMVETLGYQATTMSWGDIFPAIQSGIVDGAICCTKTATYSIFAKSDVGSHFVQYNSIPENTSYYVSEKTWEELNEAQREVVQAAFTKASDDFFAYNRENDAVFEQKLVESGYTILKLSPEEQEAMASKVRTEIWPMLEDSVGKDNIDRLLSSLK
ncbi:TRAP transporter substrate-binding protein DctP [Phaeobacter inhibens]|uniref:TRAP transporter substrate-binding protein DctP n=1 Tax=Phaeobacter inhibens TaxID=221822 RepID=UPI000C9AB929|nr:TRAP transporter substrate-binding protein DctP [Phaeobacter inhibens]AUQ61058.1 putative TRAP dicarboxylate transporter, DctP subunit [Phaeobacter inhibens]AUQ81000.1 putative TRAP dicarboxylate transporter, DctP subunit [Phaeobacter inhibens]AUQ88688.1 putative TRAP dicarboxylate transporter, DctP subunit [Phaeobacter inhibens]MDO6755683.1 TRAP transporter substrate-binding protein DctP [Phaeobacter inhibens]